MDLSELIHLQNDPAPWSEHDNIPWDEPGFSERMLAEHLSQAHDAASRRFMYIDQHIAWIQESLLAGRPGRILDLGCGPGLYSARLARLGHQCVGIDYSPASIRYAREQAQAEGLDCIFLHEDIRRADWGAGYDLVMLIFGELNVFRPAQVEMILKKARRALLPGGVLLLEPHTWEAVHRMGITGRHWYASSGGLFSPEPHLCLIDRTWDAPARAATIRYFILEAAAGEIRRYGQSVQAYRDEEYRELLERCGFLEIQFYPSLAGIEPDLTGELFVLTGR